MENNTQIDTIVSPVLLKGTCGKCGQPVYSSQHRRKTPQGVYIHMMQDGVTEGCPSPPALGTYQVSTIEKDGVPQPAAAAAQPSTSAVVDGLQNLSTGGSAGTGDGRPRTLAQSNFKKMYRRTEHSDMFFKLLNRVHNFLIAHCNKIGVGRRPADEMMNALSEEALRSIKDHGLDNVSDARKLARYLWTSGQKLGVKVVNEQIVFIDESVPLEHRREFCSILNAALRADEPDVMREAVHMVACINCLLVGSRSRLINTDEVVVFPSVCHLSDGPSCGLPAVYRGAGLPVEMLDFYQGMVGKSFRVPGFLATSMNVLVAHRFFDLARSNDDLPAALYIITFDPRGEKEQRYRCKHVNYVNVSNVPGEAEYLFAPYSPFTVTKVIKGTGSGKHPHEIYLEAGLDSLDFEEELPVTPWI